MSRMSEAHRRWRDYFSEREAAEQAMHDQHRAAKEELQRQLEALREAQAQEEKDFSARWAEEKDRRRAERDEAIIDRILGGDSQSALMRELDSNNTVLLSKLAKEARSRQNAGAIAVATKPKWRTVDDLDGWEVSADGTEYRHTAGERSFTGSMETGQFLAGDESLYMHTPPMELMGALLKLRSAHH